METDKTTNKTLNARHMNDLRKIKQMTEENINLSKQIDELKQKLHDFMESSDNEQLKSHISELEKEIERHKKSWMILYNENQRLKKLFKAFSVILEITA